MDAAIEIQFSAVQVDRLTRQRRWAAIPFLLFLLLMPPGLRAQAIFLNGRAIDPQGKALPGVSVEILSQDQIVADVISGTDGKFVAKLKLSGQLTLKAEAPGFRPVVQPITVRPSGNSAIEIRMGQLSSRIENVTVTADVNETDVLSPDPGEKVFIRQELLDANPGRPGAPVSIPGYPIETASSGIKAPQYFAPGVAGDHGEPIAQYIAVGSYLVPNNLSANAHGNGYADPNIFIPEVLESVQVDGGAFNVREGNHSVNLAATYGFRSSLDPFITFTGDYRDIDLVTGLSPSPDSWIALEGSYGNGFLDRLEHRQQYKLNGERMFHLGENKLTLFGIGYYGFSYVPGTDTDFSGKSIRQQFSELRRYHRSSPEGSNPYRAHRCERCMATQFEPTTATLRIFSHLQPIVVLRFWSGIDSPKRVPYGCRRQRKLREQVRRIFISVGRV